MAAKDDQYLPPTKQARYNQHRRSLTDNDNKKQSTPTLHSESHSAHAHSYKNGDTIPQLPFSKKKRKSEAAVYIKTSQLFTMNGQNKKHIHKKQNKQQRKIKVYHKDDLHHKYIPFDFNKYAKEQREKQPQESQNHISVQSNRPRAASHQISKNSKKQSSLQPNFNGHSTKITKSDRLRQKSANLIPNENGIKFRKSHNNIPIMHPNESEAFKKNKNFYKQRASYSVSNHHSLPVSSRKNNTKHRQTNHHKNTLYTPLHKDDEIFLNSLLEPTKKKELNEAIKQLKDVIESPNISNLIGSNIETSLREILRKLQLLRLDATLREYKQPRSKHSNQSQTDYETEDELIHSTHSSPEKSKKQHKTESNGSSKEEEQNRILQSLSNHNSEETNGDNLVSALLFASKYHKQLYTAQRKSSLLNAKESQKNGLLNGNKLIRRRFTLSDTTKIDRAGIEVARWLSTEYSTFGRNKLPHSAQSSKPSINKQKSNDLRLPFEALRLKNASKSIEDEKKEQKQKEIAATKKDINKFLKFVTSDQILLKLKGIGDDWNWCIFDLYEICGESILLLTAHFIFDQLGLFDLVNIRKFQYFFSVIQRGYKKNPYHSSLHATDVLINMYFWIKSSNEFRSYLSDLDICTALISAACHDYLHPGLTQNFQISTNSDMALKYNGRSVLENMHCSETIRLLLKPEYQIFASLKKAEFRYVRELITDMILGTDMQLHSNHIKNLNDLSLSEKIVKEQETKNILVIGLHVADIANPCKPWSDCKRWTYMLMEEWFQQGDKEKALGLAISPMMDRTKPNIPRGQVGFIDYIVKPLFDSWLKLFEITNVCIENLKINKEKWTQLNADPNCNDVDYNLRESLRLSQKKNTKIDLKQPISLDHPNFTPNSDDDDEYEQIMVNERRKNEKSKKKSKKKKKKTKKKKTKKKKKPKAVSMRLHGDVSPKNKKNRNEIIDVPFTPEQAHALHVTYDNIMDSVKENVDQIE